MIDTLLRAGFVLANREPYLPAWVQQADAAWGRLLPELRAADWQIELTCFAAPIQLEGTVPAGDRFYYWCRGNSCSLSIGGTDPADAAPWNGEKTVESDFAASYLPPDAAVRILLDLLGQWLQQPGLG